MPRYFALSLDGDHDLYLDGDGSLAIIRDSAAIAQRVTQHLKSWTGEWFLDTEAGVPWLQFVFVRPFDRAIAEAVIKDAVLAVPGVAEIETFAMEFHPDRRHVEVYDLEIRTVYDETVSVNA